MPTAPRATTRVPRRATPGWRTASQTETVVRTPFKHHGHGAREGAR
ncbi:DUF6380 family protein [Streptomyces tagetis]